MYVQQLQQQQIVASVSTVEWRRRRYGDEMAPDTTCVTRAVFTSKWTDTVDHSSNPRENRSVNRDIFGRSRRVSEHPDTAHLVPAQIAGRLRRDAGPLDCDATVGEELRSKINVSCVVYTLLSYSHDSDWNKLV